MPAVLLLLAALFAPGPPPLAAQNAQSGPAAVLYLFWGRGCPHCEKEKEFLGSLKKKYPSVVIKEYEVWYDPENREIFEKVLKSLPKASAGVPATVIGRKAFIGFTGQTAKDIEAAVSACLKQGCPDALASMTNTRDGGLSEEQKKIQVPLLGEIDPGAVSLPLLTVVLGALDSFNPCAFFVLLFLLSMLIHARSRKKMLLIGGIFVFFSGFIYFLFMAAWLNLFLIIGGLKWITTGAGLVAIAVAVINIKDFFYFKKGVSLSIPDSAKPRLFGRMRNLLRSSSLPALLGGTLVLAVSANAYELLCTAGFPMVYTRALTLHALTRARYYLYLVLYNVVYVIPLAIIVLVMTATLGSRKLSQWQGRKLKLVSGLMMFFLGLVLILDPALLNNTAASALMLASVIGLSALTIIVAQKVNPDIASE